MCVYTISEYMENHTYKIVTVGVPFGCPFGDILRQCFNVSLTLNDISNLCKALREFQQASWENEIIFRIQ